jgi:hypothetical protein
MIPAEAVDSVHWSDMIMYLKNVDQPSKLSFWIGMTDARVEGTFEWYSSGKIESFSNWKLNEPRNTETYDCVQTDTNSNRNWKMTTCSSSNYAFCESGSKNY